MAQEPRVSDASLIAPLLLIYAVLGPYGLVPALFGVIALLLARNSAFVRFVLSEHEAYYGLSLKTQDSSIESSFSDAIRKDVSAQFATEKAGLKATIALINNQLAIVTDDLEKTNQKCQRSGHLIDQLQSSQAQYRKELETLRTELATLRKEIDKKQADGNASKGLFSFPSSVLDKSAPPASAFQFGGFKSSGSILDPTPGKPESPAVAAFSFGRIEGPKPKPKPTPKVNLPIAAPKSELTREPESKPLKITLPGQLQHLDPQRSGFTCIGRAIASHGGPCGSFSDEYLPRRKRDEAAAVLRDMRSATPSKNVFDLPALRGLANNMLCIRHSRGCRYDQSDSIAQKWFDDLAVARQELLEKKMEAACRRENEERRRMDEQKVATTAPSLANLTQSTVASTAAWKFSPMPMSPASSVSSVSIAGSQTDVLDGSNAEGPRKKLFSGFEGSLFGPSTPKAVGA